ncbi:hypothetical protein N1851_000044 [Merluccius polli]|uniref:Uncharacterized protein n=1 Tax=Merluccius polli TaxID=89951 RepID=A0AA47NCM9_MERPO|nr:hypothetical protein N1851_000044 [Merluccius polli]
MQVKHIHNNPLFPKCQHPVRKSRDRKKWFQPGSKALCKVEKVLTNKRVLSDVEKLSSMYQTSTLEAFHSVILRFTPKSLPIHWDVVQTISGSNALQRKRWSHSGKNNFRETEVQVTFPKSQKRRTHCEASYVYNLIAVVFDDIVPNPQPYAGLTPKDFHSPRLKTESL